MSTILVVDDESSVREAFKVVLKDKHKVIVNENGHQALKTLKNVSADLIILDIMMPGISGIEVLEKLSENSCHAAVIVLTSPRMIKTAVEAMKMGACAYITKPLDIEEMKLVVERTLQLKTSETPLSLRSAVSPSKGNMSLRKAVQNFERGLIQDALMKTNGVQTKAAKYLKTSRRILRYKIDKLGIK